MTIFTILYIVEIINEKGLWGFLVSCSLSMQPLSIALKRLHQEVGTIENRTRGWSLGCANASSVLPWPPRMKK